MERELPSQWLSQTDFHLLGMCLQSVVELKNLGGKFPGFKWMLTLISVCEYFLLIDNSGRWLSQSSQTHFFHNKLLKLAKILRKKNNTHKSTQSHLRVTLIKK